MLKNQVAPVNEGGHRTQLNASYTRFAVKAIPLAVYM